MRLKNCLQMGIHTAHIQGEFTHVGGSYFLIGRGWLYCAIITGNLYFHVAIIIFSKESKFVS